MRKTSNILLVLLFAALAMVASAASIDGKWAGEATVKNRRQNTEQKLTITADFSSAGDVLNGTVAAGTGRRARPQTIKDGKVNGDAISFTTTAKSKQGERTVYWSGTVAGDELKLTRSQKPGAKGLAITLKRQ